MRETIACDGELSIEVSDRACKDYLGVLRSVEFGSDALRYRRLDVESHVARLGKSYFFIIRRAQHAIGVFALTPRELWLDDERLQSVYRSQLCIIDSERRRGLARYLRSSAVAWIREQLSAQPFMTWGCIDERNTNALGLLETVGGLKLGTVNSYLCYRQWPRAEVDRPMHRVSEKDYAPNGLALTVPSDAGISKLGGCSAKVDCVTLELRQYGRIADYLYRYCLRFAGPAKRRFNPTRFTYARLGGITPSNESPAQLESLIQESMVKHETHYAAIVCDPNVLSASQRRAFGRFVKTNRLAVIAENFGFPETLLNRIQNQPLYVAPIDI